MKSLLTGAALCLGVVLVPATSAATVTYIDEASFLADLNALGHAITHEGFEDDAVWGAARSTVIDGFNTAPTITSQGLTWRSNNPDGNITTSDGAARSGDWGLFAYPHGSYASDGVNGLDCTIPGECGDSFVGEAGSGELLFGIGGWIRTNTPPAELGMFVDGVAQDFGETCDSSGENCVNNASLSGSAFFGVIDTSGFSSFEYRDLEGTLDEMKYLFADDFYYAGTATVVPVPAAVWLFASGVLMLASYGFNRK